MELCGKQKKKEWVLYSRFFKVATFCFDDSFAHSWHSLKQLHEVVTWNGFPTVLEEFPDVLSTCWLLCLHSAVQFIPPRPSQLGLGWVIVEARSSDPALPSLSFLVK